MIQLFKKGTSGVHFGVTCDAKLFDGFGFEPLLAENGGEWYLDPQDCYEEPKVESKSKPKSKPKVKAEFKSSLSAKEK